MAGPKRTLIPRLLWMVLGHLLLTGCSEPSGVGINDGPVLWSVPAQGAHTRPLVLDSLVVFGALDGAALAFDRRTGELVWRRVLIPDYEVRGREIHTAAGMVLVPAWDLWALDPATGNVRWRFGGPDGAAAGHEVATAGDTVFTASSYTWASAVDGRTGEPYWSVDLGESVWRPAVSEELVIYGTSAYSVPDPTSPRGHLIALRRSDGSEAWRYPLSGGAVSGGVVWQDRVIVGDNSSWVYALRLKDGSLGWKVSNGSSPNSGDYWGRPVLIGEVAILARGDNVVEGREVRSGEQLWTWEAGAPASLVALFPHVYAFTGHVTVGDRTGTILWQYGGGSYVGGVFGGLSLFNGGVASDGTIYTLGTGINRGGPTSLYAFRPDFGPDSSQEQP